MAYQNYIFPAPLLIHNVQREYIQPTTIAQNGVREYRVQKQRFGRHRWTLNQKSFNPAGLAEVLNFLDAREYSLYSFGFADPLDQAGYNNTVLSWDAGSNWKLQKLDAAGVLTTHPIFHVSPDTVVKKNGVSTAYSVTTNAQGLPVVTVSGATSTDTITITGTPLHAVRLDQSSTTTTVAALDSSNKLVRALVGEIILAEVFE